MPLTRDDVRKIAFLARIRVPDDALDGLAGELSGIIGWVEQLNEVETDGIEPMTSVAAMALPRREDKVTDGDKPDDILANAPESRRDNADNSGGGYFVVPKVVE